MAALGFVVTLAAVIGLTCYAEPQHHHQIAGKHRVEDPPEPGVHARNSRARLARDARAPGPRPRPPGAGTPFPLGHNRVEPLPYV